MIVTKYITRKVVWVNCFLLYVIHHIGITQRSHDHLFQKLWHLGATWVHKLANMQKSTNYSFFLLDCNQINFQMGFVGQFVPSICNSSYWYSTKASWPFISKVQGATWVHQLASKQKRQIRDFSL